MKKLVVSMTLLLAGLACFAQEKYFYLALDMNKPLSNRTWISDASTRGFRGGYRAFINDRLSAGLDISSSTYDQYHPTETKPNGNGAITTDYFKYVYSYSAAISGQYNFEVGDPGRFYPYAGLGLGVNNNSYVMYYNIYQDTDRRWGFLARPEVGILVTLGRQRAFGVMAAAHYDYSTNSSDKFAYRNFSTAGVSLGIIFID